MDGEGRFLHARMACRNRLRTFIESLRKCLEKPCPEMSERHFHATGHAGVNTPRRRGNSVKLPFILSRSLSCDLHHLVSLYLIEFRDVIVAVKDETAFKAGLDFFHVILETL